LTTLQIVQELDTDTMVIAHLFGEIRARFISLGCWIIDYHLGFQVAVPKFNGRFSDKIINLIVVLQSKFARDIAVVWRGNQEEQLLKGVPVVTLDEDGLSIFVGYQYMDPNSFILEKRAINTIPLADPDLIDKVVHAMLIASA
jgi:hypothetical protein